mgnify:CR=1 FL=1
MTAYKLSQAESRYCRNMTEVVLPVMAEELKLSKDWTYKELYLAVLEATAKLCRISKYKVYTVDELREKIQEKLHGLSGVNCCICMDCCKRNSRRDIQHR